MAKTIQETEYYAHPIGMQWSVIFAGAAVATAISIVLVQFGSIVGLSADGPLRGEGFTAMKAVLATGIWLLWVQLLASLAGGYIAGSMRSSTPFLSAHENEMRDGIYGLTVWATSTVAVFIALSLAAAGAAYVEVNSAGEQIVDSLTEAEENAAIIFAFFAGATSLVSAGAAWWASVMGGDHREKKVDFSEKLSFKK